MIVSLLALGSFTAAMCHGMFGLGGVTCRAMVCVATLCMLGRVGRAVVCPRLVHVYEGYAFDRPVETRELCPCGLGYL